MNVTLHGLAETGARRAYQSRGPSQVSPIEKGARMHSHYPGAGNVAQWAYVVEDIDTAMIRWQQVGGAGPFHVLRESELDVLYRGAPAKTTLSFGLAQVGDVHIELIQQHDDGPSAYRDVYPRGSSGGFHHVALVIPDVDAAVDFYARQGCEVAMSMNWGGMPVAYIDTRSELGCMTEVMRNDPVVTELHAQVAAAAVGWDGSDPVRTI